MDERIARLAARQHGLVSLNQLRRLGLGRGAIAHRIHSGKLHPIHVGVYAVGHAVLTPRAQMLAAVMACGSEAALSHEHGAELWGLTPPWAEVDLSVIQVIVPRASRRGRRPGIKVHKATLQPVDLCRRDEIPVTSLPRTLIDLAAVQDRRDLERAIDQALTDQRLDPRELWDALRRYPTSPGTRAVRRVLAAADRRSTVTDSKLEERFLELVRDARLPPPALNVRIGRMRVDAVWHDRRVAVELDGYTWHRTRGRQDADRRREAALRGFGYTPLRYSAAQVIGQPLAVVADVVAALTKQSQS